MYRTLQVCSSRGGYEAVPDPPRPLDLARAKGQLEREGIPVVDARVMLIAALDVEVTIGRSGRLLFKTQDAAAAERAFARLRPLLDLPPERDVPPGAPRSGGGPGRGRGG